MPRSIPLPATTATGAVAVNVPGLPWATMRAVEPSGPQSWHHGVIAKWWAEFNVDGPEIAYFRQFIEADGQPALDVACGTGRLLLPYLRAGLDVDGCDISTDMLDLCQARAAREGQSAPNLYEQAMHELDLPRAYRTIIVCGGFGIGSTREQDLDALECFYDHLEPGGLLVMDKEMPYADSRRWSFWSTDGRRSLPEDWMPPGEPRQGSDGSQYALRTRIVDIDPLLQRVTMQIRAAMWLDGEPVEEERTLTENFYFRNELLMMLERAGFVDIVVRGATTDDAATADHDFLVFLARKPTAPA